MNPLMLKHNLDDLPEAPTKAVNLVLRSLAPCDVLGCGHASDPSRPNASALDGSDCGSAVDVHGRSVRGLLHCATYGITDSAADQGTDQQPAAQGRDCRRPPATRRVSAVGAR